MRCLRVPLIISAAHVFLTFTFQLADSKPQGDSILTAIEKVFYRFMCGLWGITPQILGVSTWLNMHKKRILQLGPPPSCAHLILKIEFSLPTRSQVESLRKSTLPILWVLGGPGSGKGTFCTRFKEAENYEHISVGDLIRAEVEAKPDVGQILQHMMREGQLVPDFVPVVLLTRKMQSDLDKTLGFLIDGFPRTVEQAKLFQDIVRPPNAIIVLDVSDSTLHYRMSHRNQGRVDDNDETFKKRLAVYYAQTYPVITHPMFVAKVHKVNVEENDVDQNSAKFSAAIKKALSQEIQHRQD